MPEDERIPLHFLVYWSEDDQGWLARCLDFDILGVGTTQDEAVACLKLATDAHLAYAQEHDLSPFRASPEEYWALYRQAAERTFQRKHRVEAFTLAAS